MPVLFAVTLFVSATLLFLVQPMVGKMILPLLGGSPAAWNTCMVFFQTLLLGGYLYAHLLTTRFRVPAQTTLHLVVLSLALLWLGGSAIVSPSHSPVAIVRSLAPGSEYPVLGVLGLLAIAIGLPFLVVSTSAPLLQRWFADTNHPSSRDPYFLYAASNAGSLLSLLLYPLLIEPTLTLTQQAWLWTIGYAVLVGLVYQCGVAARHPLPGPTTPPPASATPTLFSPTTRPSWFERLRWLGLAFVPSSLMLSVTFHMTTDIASVPLLWVIPLALYLLTFIIAYARTPEWSRPLILAAAPVSALLLVFILVSDVLAGKPFQAVIIHLTVFFLVSLLMHSELARRRPHPVYLTEYFLWISLGGVAGGIFNALIAPALFNANYEYPITLAIGCLLVPAMTTAPPRPATLRTYLFDALAVAGVAGLVWLLTGPVAEAPWFSRLTRTVADAADGVGGLSVNYKTVSVFALYAFPCMACFLFIERPVRFGLCVAALLGVCLVRNAEPEGLVWSARSPFGILRVFERPGVQYAPDTPHRELLHGTTLHGTQASGTDPNLTADQLQPLAAVGPWQAATITGALRTFNPHQEPLTYYHRTGPVGWMIRRAREANPTGSVAMVGLGTGSIAAYARPADRLTIYEIDKTVVDLVESGRYFTYVNDARARGADVRIVLGDARLQLEETTDRYDLLLVDAFSSDSIPVHMLTREAIELYKNRLAPNGILALHISNKYVDLEPVVARLIEEASLVARVFRDHDDAAPGKALSTWVAVAQTESDLGEMLTGPHADTRFGAVSGGYGYLRFNHPWETLTLDPNVAAWTDDYSDVLRVMQIPEIRKLRRRLGLPVSREEP